ncbi:MAG: signal peptidase I [Akkermansiaceae bacterium]|nr:signal peptidase I [Akkermansiaceae bacterium]
MLIPAFLGIVLAHATERLRPYRVPTGAMNPALEPGDNVIAEGISYLFRKPRRGELVVFRTRGIPRIQQWNPNPNGGDFRYIERLVGLPGDRIRIREGVLYVNDVPLEITAPDGERIVYTEMGIHAVKTDFIVPENAYFALGDNSGNSSDSRYWGTIPAGDLLSRVVLRYYPLGKMGGVH